MRKFKEGDVVRLKGTLIKAVIINNNCNGYYNLRFNDGTIQFNVHASEIDLTIYDIIKEKYNKFIKFRMNMEQYFELKSDELRIIINIVIFLFLLILSWLTGVSIYILIH